MNHQGTKLLETKRLILRRFTLEDAEDMFLNWASDPDVTEFLTWPPHADVNVTKTLLTDWISRYSEPACYNWAIELKTIHKVIGNISAIKVNEKVESVDIGYCMGKTWWGKEIMPEALCAVIDYLFDEIKVNRIAACHDENNPKSGRVMEKAGMKQEGVWRAAVRNQHGICNLVWYSILKSDKEGFQRLFKNITDQIKEAQLKLGYAKETIRLYYPPASLYALTGIHTADSQKMCDELKNIFTADICLHPAFFVRGDRIEASIPPEGAEYVHHHVEDPLFLKDLITLFHQNPHSPMEEIKAVFNRHNETFICETMPPNSDFDCVMYFPNGEPDEYYYCFKEEMGHVIYHRFMKEDYFSILKK